MALVKASHRTKREACKKCGDEGPFYWATDTARVSANGRPAYVLIVQNSLTDSDAAKKGDVVPDSTRHVCDPSKVTPASPVVANPAPVAVDPSPAPVAPAENAVAAPVAPMAPAGTPSELDALRTLLTTILGTPQIDRAEVERIAREVIEGVVFPTRMVVVRDNVQRAIEGTSHRQLADVTMAVLAGEHVMMVGPAGTGKSTIAEQSAEALGLRAFSISLSPQTPASAFLGYMDANGNYVRTLFREAYENGGLFHFDEVDNAHPSVLAVINAALANGHMAFPDGMVKRHDDFRAVASANTYGRGATRAYVGRQQLDAATLDRFTVLTIDIDEALESALANATGATTQTVEKVLTFVRKLRANAARNGLNVVLSPRASVGMCRLIHAGMDWDNAVDARVRRGLDDSTWQKLSA